MNDSEFETLDEVVQHHLVKHQIPGIAVGTAKSRLSRAREALARQLVDGEEEVGSGRR